MNNRTPDVTGNALKLIAIISMLTDHIGMVLYPEIDIFRCIGRLAFPIFVFLLAEGYRHSSDRRHYFFRLCIFAAISELPYDLAVSKAPDPQECNIFFTLAIGFAAMMIADSIGERLDAERSKSHMRIFAIPLLLVAAFLLADFIGSDYGSMGVLAIFVCHSLYRVNMPHWMRYAIVCGVLVIGWPIEAWALTGIVPVFFYRGRLGRKSKAFKYFCYGFYPAHLLVLYLISTMKFF